MNIEKQIEFDKIKEIWSGLAITDKAKERIKDTTVYLYENELRKHLRDTTEARFFIEKIGDATFTKYFRNARYLANF